MIKARYHAATGGHGQTRPPDDMQADDTSGRPADTPADDDPVDDTGTFAPKAPK